MDIYKAVFNTAFITVVTVTGQLFFASLAGFAFAREGDTFHFVTSYYDDSIPSYSYTSLHNDGKVTSYEYLC